jgi:hypothetical protein
MHGGYRGNIKTPSNEWAQEGPDNVFIQMSFLTIAPDEIDSLFSKLIKASC